MNEIIFNQIKGKKLQEYKDKFIVDQELKAKHKLIGEDLLMSLK